MNHAAIAARWCAALDHAHDSKAYKDAQADLNRRAGRPPGETGAMLAAVWIALADRRGASSMIWANLFRERDDAVAMVAAGSLAPFIAAIAADGGRTPSGGQADLLTSLLFLARRIHGTKPPTDAELAVVDTLCADVLVSVAAIRAPLAILPGRYGLHGSVPALRRLGRDPRQHAAVLEALPAIDHAAPYQTSDAVQIAAGIASGYKRAPDARAALHAALVAGSATATPLMRRLGLP